MTVHMMKHCHMRRRRGCFSITGEPLRETMIEPTGIDKGYFTGCQRHRIVYFDQLKDAQLMDTGSELSRAAGC